MLKSTPCSANLTVSHELCQPDKEPARVITAYEQNGRLPGNASRDGVLALLSIFAPSFIVCSALIKLFKRGTEDWFDPNKL